MAQQNVRTLEGYVLGAYGSSQELTVSNATISVPGTAGQVNATADTADCVLILPPPSQFGNLIVPLTVTQSGGFSVRLVNRDLSPAVPADPSTSGFYLLVAVRGTGTETYRVVGPF